MVEITQDRVYELALEGWTNFFGVRVVQTGPPKKALEQLLRVKLRKNQVFLLCSESYMRGIQLPEMRMCKLQAEKSDLTGAILHGADLEGAYLEGANLTGAILNNANLYAANLERTNLTSAGAIGTKFDYALLTEANLRRADLSRATLQHAKMERANVEGATLWYTDLTHAHLEEANVEGAKFDNTNFTSAHIAGIRGLLEQQHKLGDSIFERTKVGSQAELEKYSDLFPPRFVLEPTA